MTPETTGRKQTEGRFLPGKSGNPMGRPKGARNRSTMAALALLEGEAEALTRKAVDLAMGGDLSALRLCLERILPTAKDRLIPAGCIELPDLAPGNVAQAIAAVVHAVAGGCLLPSDGQVLSSLLEAHRKAVEVEDIERRISALETDAEMRSRA